MFSYTRGVIVAYRDVLSFIESIESDQEDIKLEEVKDHIEQRIDKYLSSANSNKDID